MVVLALILVALMLALMMALVAYISPRYHGGPLPLPRLPALQESLQSHGLEEVAQEALRLGETPAWHERATGWFQGVAGDGRYPEGAWSCTHQASPPGYRF